MSRKGQQKEALRGEGHAPACGFPDRLPVAELCGIGFASITERECVEIVMSRAARGVGGWLITPNVDILRQCVKDPVLGDMVRSADLVVADGMPLVWASQLQGTPLPERVAGSALISSLSEAAADRGLSVFLLGGRHPGTATGAAEVLRKRHPRLEIAGTCYPEFGFEKDQERVREIREQVAAAAPDIVFVALGFPKAEWLVTSIRPARPEAWWGGVGISFSFLTGEVRSAPHWMQRSGLEWLHRLAQEPRRLAPRYLLHGIPFGLKLLIGAAWKGLKRKRSTQSG